MCRDSDQVVWLVKRMLQLCARWPGAMEMRRVYCSKYRPLDGVELIGPSEAFPDGVPSERQVEAPAQLALPAGRVATAAASIDGTVADLAKAKRITRAGQPTRVRDIPILSPGQRITQDQIDAAVQEIRERVAREELEGQ